MDAKQHQLDAEELTPRSFNEYKATCDLLVEQFGKRRLADDLAAPDFEAPRATMARRLGPVALGNAVQRVRTVFKYGLEAGKLDQPMRYGPQFKKPSKTVMRKHRTKTGPKLFEAEEVRKLLGAAGVQLRAMLYLGLNCGFGGHDCAALPLSAPDLERGWVNFPRPKTGVSRRCPLWPETVAALRAALEARPKPDEYAACGVFFVTKYGKPWVQGNKAEALSHEFTNLTKRLGIEGRKGRGFYTLRHVFRAAADASGDFPAVRLVMGHVDSSIDDVYRERIDDTRLEDVVALVRRWLWAEE